MLKRFFMTTLKGERMTVSLLEYGWMIWKR